MPSALLAGDEEDWTQSPQPLTSPAVNMQVEEATLATPDAPSAGTGKPKHKERAWEPRPYKYELRGGRVRPSQADGLGELVGSGSAQGQIGIPRVLRCRTVPAVKTEKLKKTPRGRGRRANGKAPTAAQMPVTSVDLYFEKESKHVKKTCKIYI